MAISANGIQKLTALVLTEQAQAQQASQVQQVPQMQQAPQMNPPEPPQVNVPG